MPETGLRRIRILSEGLLLMDIPVFSLFRGGNLGVIHIDGGTAL